MSKYNSYLLDEEINEAMLSNKEVMAYVAESCDTFISWCATPNNIEGHFYRSSKVDEDARQEILIRLLLAIQKFRNEERIS